jgi:hypothetical protein
MGSVQYRLKRVKRLQKVTRLLLEPQTPAYSLQPEVVEIMKIITGSQTIHTTRHEDIDYGETLTSNGLAISPTMAAMCADDFVRTIEFIRGTYAAINDTRNRFTDRPVQVLYVGCGPYATLAVPLMAVLSSTEAVFTLLDLHPESITSAEAIVNALGFGESATRFETIDAGSYRVDPEQPPDVILIEIMQACLEKEPQVAITRRLLKQAPHAILIPEEIGIELTLVNTSREFNLDDLGCNRGIPQRDRIPVASVFIVNRETVKSWEGNYGYRLIASIVRIPDFPEQRYQPMLFTSIRVYKEHVLKDYDSGLTCPRSPSIEDTINSGDMVQFHYELGSHPRLIGQVISR